MRCSDYVHPSGRFVAGQTAGPGGSSELAMPLMPEQYPLRANEGHVAVRMGDSPPYYRVTIDGRDVSLEVDEAIPGRPGAVHYCRVCAPDGAALRLADYWQAGHVTVETYAD